MFSILGLFLLFIAVITVISILTRNEIVLKKKGIVFKSKIDRIETVLIRYYNIKTVKDIGPFLYLKTTAGWSAGGLFYVYKGKKNINLALNRWKKVIENVGYSSINNTPPK